MDADGAASGASHLGRSPLSDPGASVRLALDGPRARMARTSDRVRIVGAAAFWLLHFLAGTVFGLDNWRGNLDLWTVYLALAVAVALLAPRFPRLRARTVRLVAVLDMPMLFVITDRLAPLGDDPSAVVGFTAGGYVLFILWSAMALEPRLTATAALIAGGLEAALFYRIGSDPAGLVASVLLMGLAGFLTIFVSQRLGSAMTGLTEARVRREEAERSMAEKDRFVSTVSHDFRTPLAVIFAALQTLDGSPELSPEERKSFLDGAIRQCRRMMGMSEELLRLARLGSQPLEPTRLALLELMQSSLRDLTPRAEAAGRRLTLAGGDAVDADVEGPLVERALVNLVDNALRYTPPGGEVRVGLERQGPLAVMWVEDDGPGVPPAERAHIFEPFHRAEASGGGAGLGLAIVREVARLHGGEASVEAAVGGGARFCLSVSAADRAARRGGGAAKGRPRS